MVKDFSREQSWTPIRLDNTSEEIVFFCHLQIQDNFHIDRQTKGKVFI